MKPSIEPSNATVQDVIWTSSNTKVATVKDGVVTGVATGNCIVIVKTKDGSKTASCNVEVIADGESTEEPTTEEPTTEEPTTEEPTTEEPTTEEPTTEEPTTEEPTTEQPTPPIEDVDPEKPTHNYVNGICEDCGASQTVVVDGMEYTVIPTTDGSLQVSVKQSSDTVDVEKLDIPATVTIDENQFAVTTIEENAFKDSAVVEVIIPESVTTIGSEAFVGCDKLNVITFKGKDAPTIADNAISINESLTINVPVGAKDDYQQEIGTDVLIEEKESEEPTPDYIVGDANGDGKVSTVDIVLIRQHLAGGYDITINTDAADVNGDNKVTTADLVLIRRYIAGGYDVEFKKP